MNGQKVIVTGGAGFIGSHLVERLLGDGENVIVLDNFSNGKRENLDNVSDNSRLTISDVDVSDFDKIKDHFHGVHSVYHLAALADIVPSIREPLKYHRSNVDGTISVLEAARMAGVRRFVYAASSSCYGISDELPTRETAPIKPMYPYALTKYVGEQYVTHWGRVYDMPCVSLRLFNVYGPRARTSGTYGAVFGVFLAQKLAGSSFTIVGDGEQRRDFVFVNDVVEAFIRAARSNIRDEIFNIGSGTPQSINSLVKLLGGKSTHIPKRPGEPECTHADTLKVKEALGWESRVSFEEGVEIMLSHIDNWRGSPVWNPESIKEATREWFAYLAKD
ncbi:MAG: SDR family oxidoreductase [Candidatus Omnitrophota bacterium]